MRSSLACAVSPGKCATVVVRVDRAIQSAESILPVASPNALSRIRQEFDQTAFRRPGFMALDNQCPIERQIMKHGVILKIPEPGGLHHRYERIAASRGAGRIIANDTHCDCLN